MWNVDLFWMYLQAVYEVMFSSQQLKNILIGW
jgi:hypothetical protein